MTFPSQSSRPNYPDILGGSYKLHSFLNVGEHDSNHIAQLSISLFQIFLFLN